MLEKAISVFDANQMQLQQTENFLKKYDYQPQSRFYTHSDSIRGMSVDISYSEPCVELLIEEEPEEKISVTPDKENCAPDKSPLVASATPSSPVNMGLFREVDDVSKTPVLATRHLSAATQQIIESKTPLPSSEIIYYASPSPVAAPEAGYMTPESPSALLERSLSTMHHRYDISPPSPDTPELHSPLKSSFVFASTVASHMTTAQAPAQAPASPDSVDDGYQPQMPRKVHFAPDEDADSDGEDPILATELTLRTSKILQPRSTKSEGWIPLVTGQEWNSVPSFLKLQVSELYRLLSNHAF